MEANTALVPDEYRGFIEFVIDGARAAVKEDGKIPRTGFILKRMDKGLGVMMCNVGCLPDELAPLVSDGVRQLAKDAKGDAVLFVVKVPGAIDMRLETREGLNLNGEALLIDANQLGEMAWTAEPAAA